MRHFSRQSLHSTMIETERTRLSDSHAPSLWSSSWSKIGFQVIRAWSTICDHRIRDITSVNVKITKTHETIILNILNYFDTTNQYDMETNQEEKRIIRGSKQIFLLVFTHFVLEETTWNTGCPVKNIFQFLPLKQL